MMVEIPSNVILLNEFIDVGIDGVSIGSNDLTQLTLGIDRDNAILAKDFDERNLAVMRSLEQIVKTCRAARHNVVDLRAGAFGLPGDHGEAGRVGDHVGIGEPGRYRADAEDRRGRGGEAGDQGRVSRHSFGDSKGGSWGFRLSLVA